MQERAIDIRRIDDQGVAARDVVRDQHPVREGAAVAAQHAEDRATEQVAADFTHQARLDAKAVQRETGV